MTTVMMMTRSADHTGQREQIKHCSLSRECAVKKIIIIITIEKKEKKKKTLHESDSRVSLLLGSSRFLSGCERDRLFIRPRGELYVTGSKPRPHVTDVKPASTRVTFPLATMDVLEQRHQTMARGPNSARSVIIFDPWGNTKSLRELAVSLLLYGTCTCSTQHVGLIHYKSQNALLEFWRFNQDKTFIELYYHYDFIGWLVLINFWINISPWKKAAVEI